MKKIAVLTMARNDENFLRKWVEYYSALLGEENLFIYMDGLDQHAPTNAGQKAVHVQLCPHPQSGVVDFEKYRLGFLSDRAAELFAAGYEIVIGVDADEFLAVDPAVGKSLPQYLDGLKIDGSVSALGLDVGHIKTQEAPFDWSRPFLQQRSRARVFSRYTKPSVLGAPLRWGSGFHRIKGKNFHIDPNLYLFHYGCFDYDFLMAKARDTDWITSERHMKKRFKTIDLVTKKKCTPNADRTFRIARFVQSILRPVYAWNKPGHFSRVVLIPERFKTLM